MQLYLVMQYFNIIVPLKEQADLKPVKEEPYCFSLLRPQNRAMQLQMKWEYVDQD